MDGILNIRKEKGFTSHDVVAVVRRILHIRKVGHTGTLDPDAEGVLPICVGKATKLSDVIMDGTKSYRAMVRLGITTTTEDAAGEIIEEKPVDFDTEKIQKVVLSMIGEQEQIPPMYSAIKVNGKKLYELAREGKEIARKARKITIYHIAIRQFLPPNRLEIDVDCSKGTYIRTLCSDIGKALGCGAHMEALLRTKTGAFTLENAITLDQLQALADAGQTEQVFLSMDSALSDYPKAYTDIRARKMLLNGGRIYEPYFQLEPKKQTIQLGDIITVYDDTQKLTGLYTLVQEADKRCLKPWKMLI